MIKILYGFLTLTIAYHIVHTVGVFGIASIDGAMLATLWLLAWIIICGIILIQSSILRRPNIRPLRASIAVLGLLGVWSLVWSLAQGSNWSDILIGSKYDLLPLIITAGGALLGLHVDRHVHLERTTFRRLLKSIRLILVGGLVWQFAKIAWPSLFDLVGYGPIGDYILGQRPPLYYRTGPDGMMRYQGIFAGPNNLGYRLVALGPLILWTVFGRHKMELPWKVLLLGLFLLSAVLTFSRGVIVALLVQVMILIWWLAPQYKKYVYGLGVIGGLGVALLSYLKPGSTIGHMEARVDGSKAFVQQPLGYGLGSAGPAVHFQGVYLPENHYLQILLDIGIPGLVLWLLCVWLLCRPALRRGLQRNDWYSQIMIVMILGLLGLMIEGMFLHTFEDSMLSYLFLFPLGLMIGVLHSR